MIGIEIDSTEQFADLEKEEEKRFFKVGGKRVRTAAKRLRDAIRRNAPRHAGPYSPSHKGRIPGTLAKAFVHRVRTKKREGIIEGKVQPKGGIRSKGGQWHIARWLEYGTKRIRARGFIRRSQMEQEAAMTRDLEAAAED